MNISEKLIKKHTDNIIYQRGEDFYKAGKVTEMEVQQHYYKNEAFYVYEIVAAVEAAYYDEYYVEILISEKTGFISVDCNCPFFADNHRKMGFCKHIVAVMLKFIKEYYSKSQFSIERSKIDKLLKDIKYNAYKFSEHKDKLKLEINYFYDIYEHITSSVELKIGIDKLYVVRNMKQFLQAIERNQPLEFGKGFTFKPMGQRFLPEDKKFIELLLEINEISNMMDANEWKSNMLIKGKRAYFTDRQLNRLFTVLKDKEINVNIQGKQHKKVKIVHGNMPLNFEVKGSNDEIVLHHEEELPRPLSSNGRFFFFKDNVYVLTNDQLKIYVPLYNFIMSERSRKICFDLEEGQKIASYIIPGLKKISESLYVDESVKNAFYEEELVTKIYLDKEKEIFVAEVKFCYGDLEINPLKEEVLHISRGIIIRDLDKETKAIEALESYGFIRESEKFLMEKDKDQLRFLEEGLESLKSFSEVYYSEAFRNIRFYNYRHLKSGVRVSDQGLLQFDFHMEDIDPKEISNILNSIRQKKKYYRLKDGSFVDLQHQEFSKIASVMEYLNLNEKELFSKGSALIPRYNAFYLEEALRDDLKGFRKDFSFKKLMKEIEEEKKSNYFLPDNLDKIMRNYQKEGFKWLKTLAHYGFGGILADEMGLGKTLQTIAFIASEKGERPSLVVAPTSLIYNWYRETEKFAPQLKVIVIAGSPKEREELMANIQDYDMVITSYPLIRRDIENYKKITFKYCILDEAQHIKNPLSQNSYAVKSINAEGYFALTGTPLENSLTELWSIFDFIMPGYLFNHHKFIEKYEIPIVREEDEEVLATLNKQIKPFILRRLKKDVIEELPSKIEHKLVVDMTEEQKKLYNAYMLSARKAIETEHLFEGISKNKIQIIALLIRLRQICCDPTLFIENYQGESGKMQALEELLEEMLKQKHRVLIFSQFTLVLKNIADRLRNKEIAFYYLDGSTPAQERNDLVNDFNAGSKDIFLISLKAGGTGLNLTGADIVIHFDPWWNPAVEQQATDRAHRIGQEKTVQVIKLISKDTIEEKIYNLQEKKREIFDKVVEGSACEMSLISKLSESEIRELFIL
ncbi:MAG: ATP-dependent helicase [Clostridiales bacterium]|nr:ATP-dependent helicase [Clostridiales bacterium]